MTLKERAASLKRDIPAVFLALKSKETPLTAKILALITVAYALSPIDLIPDCIPVLGYLAFLSAAAYSIWGLLLQHNPVSRVAIFGFLNPVCGVVLSALLLREGQHIHPLQCVAALALVSSGIYIINHQKIAVK